jgi:hypothetical protein
MAEWFNEWFNLSFRVIIFSGAFSAIMHYAEIFAGECGGIVNVVL